MGGRRYRKGWKFLGGQDGQILKVGGRDSWKGKARIPREHTCQSPYRNCEGTSIWWWHLPVAALDVAW